MIRKKRIYGGKRSYRLERYSSMVACFHIAYLFHTRFWEVELLWLTSSTLFIHVQRPSTLFTHALTTSTLLMHVSILVFGLEHGSNFRWNNSSKVRRNHGSKLSKVVSVKRKIQNSNFDPFCHRSFGDVRQNRHLVSILSTTPTLTIHDSTLFDIVHP